MTHSRARPSPWILGVLLVTVACGREPAAPPRPGLTVFVDSRVAWQGSRQELLQKSTDYTRGSLKGWTVFGGLIPGGERKRVKTIEVIAADGRHLTIDAPQMTGPAFAPVVYVDREDRLRFTMLQPRASGGVPHGRGPGDGRGGGGQQGSRMPLTLEDVTEIRVAMGAPSVESPGARGTTPGELVLAIGAKTERLPFDALKAEAAEPLPDRPGEQAWPLRALVARRTDRRVARVTVVGRQGETHVVDAAAWEGPGRLDLRLNRRGLLKFEARAEGTGGGRQSADVRDVARVDVTVE